MGGGGRRSYTKVHKAYTSPLNETSKELTGSIFEDDDECSNISFNDILQNVNPPAISTINPDDILRVSLKSEAGRITVVVVSHAGDICGYLVSPRAIELIDCLQKGILYTAKVLGINNIVSVHISKKK